MTASQQFKDHLEYFSHLQKYKEIIEPVKEVKEIIEVVKVKYLCPVCEKKYLVKNGIKKLKRITKQLWSCTICNYDFNCPLNKKPESKHRVNSKIRKQQKVFEICPLCKYGKLIRNGIASNGKQVFKCNNCHKKGFNISFKRKLMEYLTC